MELTKELVRKVHRDIEEKLYEACSRIRFDDSLPEKGIATDLIFDSLRRIWDERNEVKQVMIELDIWREQWEDEDDAV